LSSDIGRKERRKKEGTRRVRGWVSKGGRREREKSEEKKEELA